MYRAEFQPAWASSTVLYKYTIQLISCTGPNFNQPGQACTVQIKTICDNMAGTDRQMNDPNILKSMRLFKKTNSENVSTPKVGDLNVAFALNLRIYRSLRGLKCLK